MAELVTIKRVALTKYRDPQLGVLVIVHPGSIIEVSGETWARYQRDFPKDWELITARTVSDGGSPVRIPFGQELDPVEEALVVEKFDAIQYVSPGKAEQLVAAGYRELEDLLDPAREAQVEEMLGRALWAKVRPYLRDLRS